ncbi:MAG: Mur ligase family protein [Maricaulaceae bacterium]|jgi:UDP-N-acetylmuramate--alanine ligase
MSENRRYFFCGIGGSGMMPLALMLIGRGATVDGSDRSYYQGRTPEKFAFLKSIGVNLFPQDGSGVTSSEQIVVASAAVEETVPDIASANRVGAQRMTRAELLSSLFNAAGARIAIGGTSGKSTTTAMAGWVLHAAGLAPSIVNGAVMKNFVTPQNPFASAVGGTGEAIVAEVDESDGSIARYQPTVAALNNIALDHKSLEELRRLFGDFIAKADTAVLNLDNAEVAALAEATPLKGKITYGIDRADADLSASDLEPTLEGIAFNVRELTSGETAQARLQVPGRHNVENALAALGIARACGVSLADAAAALTTFTGVRRRFERVGVARGVTVIDDFAHNPDKIAATLSTLHAFPGRILVMFQPQGFGPLKLFKDALIETFADHLNPDDFLTMSEPVYFGGTVDRAVSSQDITAGVLAAGRRALACPDRDACAEVLLKEAKEGDRIIVMGARDDTLTAYAEGLVKALG